MGQAARSADGGVAFTGRRIRASDPSEPAGDWALDRTVTDTGDAIADEAGAFEVRDTGAEVF